MRERHAIPYVCWSPSICHHAHCRQFVITTSFIIHYHVTSRSRHLPISSRLSPCHVIGYFIISSFVHRHQFRFCHVLFVISHAHSFIVRLVNVTTHAVILMSPFFTMPTNVINSASMPIAHAINYAYVITLNTTNHHAPLLSSHHVITNTV